MKKAILAYIPVLHEGYRRFIEKYSDFPLYIFGPELISEFEYLAKEIRAIDPELIKKGIEAWNIVPSVTITNRQELTKLIDDADRVIMPDEDVCFQLWQKYFSRKEVFLESVFLRWDKHNSVMEKPVNPDIVVSEKEFDKKMIKLVEENAEKSADWWRQIGALIVKEGAVIFSTFNEHLPAQQVVFTEGNPRNCFHKGVHLELVTTMHAEARAIAEAARQGVSLEGTEMYCTHFPCPPCAKLIAYSGIKKLYYNQGYGVLDGERILKDRGVEIVWVNNESK